MKKIIGFIGILLLLIGGLVAYLKITYPETSPLTSTLYFVEHLITPHAKLNKYVVGFLPYWRLDASTYIRPQLLSEINYFSFSVTDEGHLAKVVDGQTDPGWREWQSQEMKNFVTKAKIMGTGISVTITALDNELIEAILTSDNAQKNLITDIIEEVKINKLDGINIDFEYSGEPDENLKPAFTQFSKQLSTQLKKESPTTQLSLSLMPLSARTESIFDFPKIASLYNYFIGMSYDYYGANSDIAGPIAPMKGFKENKYFFDVETTYEDYAKVIPKEKIIMGIPYYGWEWAVEDGKTINSYTYPTDHANSYAAVISYTRARESRDLKKNQCQWDTYAMETWCWFTDKKTGVDHQVWLADNKSIGTRFDFANKQKFSGIAIWTLGYDKNYPDLWQLLKTKFSN